MTEHNFERTHFQDDIVYSPRSIADDKRGVDYTDSRMRDLVELINNDDYTGILFYDITESIKEKNGIITGKIDSKIEGILDYAKMYSPRLKNWRNDSIFDSLKMHFMDYIISLV